MINKIRDFLIKYNLNNPETAMVIGLSGGFDSLALTDILAKLRNEYNFKLYAAHLNHGWRKEADQDELNCKNFCKKNNIEIYTEKLSDKVAKTETAAREARYEFYARACKFFNAKNIITAHTKSDNAETLIYRIAKGTGIKGLCAIEEIQDYKGLKLLRPLLFASRTDIETYCKENNLNPNNDKSNFDTKYRRNLIRHEVLPVLKQINPQVENALNSLSELAKDQEAIIDEYLNSINRKIRHEKTFLTQEFIKLSAPLKNRVIYNLITELNPDYDRKKVNEIVDFIEQNAKSKSGKTCSLGTNLWLFCSSKNFYTISEEKTETEPAVAIYDLEQTYKFGNYVFSTEKFGNKTENYPPETENYAIVDLSNQKNLQLRYRKAGDIFQPFGMQKPIKLKKYLINKAVPNHIKDKIVLLCNSEEVLWAAKIGISEKLRVKTRPTHIIKINEVSK